jgi:uncharacterized protein YqjF (DUF2071 family)
MHMTWHDLLFMHWPVPVAQLRPLIPPRLEIDTYEGQAWIGVVPFDMTGVRPRFVPALPYLSRTAELNVRTYVTAGGKPGVWFFSLDAANPLAVRAARRGFHLPYFDARMSVRRERGRVEYASTRTHRDAPPAEFAAAYWPTGPVRPSTSGTLDAWFTERYCLYAADKHFNVWRGEIHHATWPLQPVAVEVRVNTMTRPLGIELSDVPPLLHFARRLDVVAWLLEGV